MLFSFIIEECPSWYVETECYPDSFWPSFILNNRQKLLYVACIGFELACYISPAMSSDNSVRYSLCFENRGYPVMLPRSDHELEFVLKLFDQWGKKVRLERSTHCYPYFPYSSLFSHSCHYLH